MATRTAVKRITKSYISNTNDSFESLHRLLDETNCMSCKPGPEFKKIPVGTVIDEEKSVRWNREEVERIREEYTEEVKRLNRERNKKYNEVVIRIIALISKETGLSEEKIWDNFSEKNKLNLLEKKRTRSENVNGKIAMN